MRALGISSLVILTMAVGSAACSREGKEAAQHPAATADAAGSGDEITVTGCLTGAPDRTAFVVTPQADALTTSTLRSGQGEVPTYTYELVGKPGTGDLQAYVGRQVEVKGRLDSTKDSAHVETKDKVEVPQTSGRDDKVTPAIETKEEVDIKARRLHVTSVTPTGSPCATSR